MITTAIFAAALASCPPSPSQAAAALDLNPTGGQGERNAQMLVSATLLLEAAKADAAHARAVAEPCPLGDVQVAGAAWDLGAGDRAYVRRAVSHDAAKPVAFIFPFSDVAALLAAAKAHTPPPATRYVLVTGVGSVDTVWRAYEDLPSDAQLRADLAAALGGEAEPIVSVDLATKKVTVFVGSKNG